MALTFRRLHPRFVAEIGPVDLRRAHDGETLAEIRAGMDEHAILVFRDQPSTDDEQLAFAQRLDGQRHTRTGSAALGKNRLGDEALSDISNVAADGGILGSTDRRRMYTLGNRLWHTDASFVDPPGRYSMLSAKVVPAVAADRSEEHTSELQSLAYLVCRLLLEKKKKKKICTFNKKKKKKKKIE